METHDQVIITGARFNTLPPLAANVRITTRASTSTTRKTTCSRSTDANDHSTSLAYKARGWVVTGNQAHGVNL